MRSTSDGSEIVRGDNRDKSGINGDFLCNKGRYAFDFANNTERITQPLVRQPDGELKPVVMGRRAFDHVGKKLRELRDTRGGKSIGVIGSNRITNEEAYLLQKFARTVLGTNNIDHHRTADYVSFAQALAGQKDRTAFPARHADCSSDPYRRRRPDDPGPRHRVEYSHQCPQQPWPPLHRQLRRDQAASPGEGVLCSLRRSVTTHLLAIVAGDEAAASEAASDAKALASFRDAVKAEENLLILIGSELRGTDLKATGRLRPHDSRREVCSSLRLRQLARRSRHGPASRHAARLHSAVDSATFAEYNAPTEPGLDILEIFDAAGRGELSALYVVGSNPVSRYSVDPAVAATTPSSLCRTCS